MLEGGKRLVKRDFSGKPVAANGRLLRLLLDNGFVPVITIPIVDERGTAINSENDDLVGVLTRALKADCVIQLIEAPGLMDNVDDPASLVRRMSQAELARREGEAEGRIKRKMLALRGLAKSGKIRVIIADGRVDQPIAGALGRQRHGH